MDYNDNNNNTNFNYYPTFDSHSTEIFPHQQTQLYNDNSLNPPSTSNDITCHYTSRDSTKININNQTSKSTDNIINEEHITNLNIVNQQNFNILNSNTSDDRRTNICHQQNLQDYYIDYLKIGTINIQNRYNSKLTDIIYYFCTYNYDILGLCETGLYESTHIHKKIHKIKHPENNKNNYIYIIHDTNGINKGTGVLFLVMDKIYPRISTISFKHGRVLNLIINFKKKKTLNITNIYMPANPEGKQVKNIRNEIIKFIENIINQQNNNHYTIVMGDFNCRPKSKTDENYLILKLLKSHQFIDSAKYHTEDNEVPAITTTYNFRIDYQFINLNILSHSIHTFTQGIISSFFNTDYKTVITIFDRTFFEKKPDKYFDKFQQTIKNKPRKYTSNYNKMNAQLWHEYSINSVQIFKNWYRNFNPNVIKNQSSLDNTWNTFQQLIIEHKILSIPQKKIIEDNNLNNNISLHIRQLNNHMILLYKTKQFMNLKHIKIRYQLDIPNKDQKSLIMLIPPDKWTEYFIKWQIYSKQINNILIHMDISERLNNHISIDNFFQQKNIIYTLYDTLKHLHKKEKSKWTTERINYHINERNQNISSNQRKMINSLLERKPRKIVLDRLLIKNNNDNNYLFTNNPNIIKTETINHFQNFTSSTDHTVYSSIQDLPTKWQNIYDQSNHRNLQDKWTNMLLPILIEELEDTLQDLGKNKAPGPSGITYEDILHLHKDVKIILISIYNRIITLGIIPSKWCEALLFPIPKPYDWDSKLVNTRPITLLETPQKILVSIYSRRLNRILSTENILQYNNRASILGQSTLEPLFVIQHITEHFSKVEPQTPLWIILQDLSKAYDRVDISLLKLAMERIHLPNIIINFFINLFTYRTNRVVLPDKLSQSYNILQGIDQGEIVSPLL
jgi:hypothetical protein